MGELENEAVTDEAELQKMTSEAHRAIGWYVVAFSQLIYEMRADLSDRLMDEFELGDLAFGQATAQQIADSFFGVCRYIGDLDEAERNIANQLQTEVGEKVTERNKIMHGDWWVGGALGGARSVLEFARLVRIYPNSRDGDFLRLETYSISDLDAVSDRLVTLRVLINAFGRGALGLRMLLADESWSEDGEYRVSDVLVAKNVPKSGRGGTVVREGPRAGELYVGPLFG